MKVLYLTLGDLIFCPEGLMVERSAMMGNEKSAEGIVLWGLYIPKGRPESVRAEELVMYSLLVRWQ